MEELVKCIIWIKTMTKCLTFLNFHLSTILLKISFIVFPGKHSEFTFFELALGQSTFRLAKIPCTTGSIVNMSVFQKISIPLCIICPLAVLEKLPYKFITVNDIRLNKDDIKPKFPSSFKIEIHRFPGLICQAWTSYF